MTEERWVGYRNGRAVCVYAHRARAEAALYDRLVDSISPIKPVEPRKEPS